MYQLYSISIIAFLISTVQSAVILPIDSSSVDIRSSGKDYAYSIQENHGVAVNSLPAVDHRVPLVKVVPPVIGKLVKQAQMTIQHDEQQPVKQEDSATSKPQTKTSISTHSVQQDFSYIVPLAALQIYNDVAYGYPYALAYSYQYPYHIIPRI